MTPGDILVLAVLALIVGAVIGNLLRNRKKGGCCGSCISCATCSGCAMANSCRHKK